MKGVLVFIFWFAIAMIALFIAIVLGQYGSWYFAWVLGTVMIVLVAAASTIRLDTEEERMRE